MNLLICLVFFVILVLFVFIFYKLNNLEEEYDRKIDYINSVIGQIDARIIVFSTVLNNEIKDREDAVSQSENRIMLFLEDVCRGE